MTLIRIIKGVIITLFATMLLSQPAWAFCGFYVSKADSKLYNQASQVIIARDGDRTVLTMANDYQGNVKDFAIVVPIPVILTENQVHVGEPKIIERLDSFSAPRLVEYFDEDPCNPVRFYDMAVPAPLSAGMEGGRRLSNEALGVTIEEQFRVGEYDILILSATQSDGLETWLRQNDYQIPSGATSVLGAYIRDGLKFFVARVNLEEFANTGYQQLRPLMMAYESPRFMLPIRLGMVNGAGDQDLIAYLLSPKGRVELTNYRTVKIPSEVELPEFVEDEFKDFYLSTFQRDYEKEGKNIGFLEYAWDMSWCDPCAADPLTPEELKGAGVFWLDDNQNIARPGIFPPVNNVFITRLHVRYTRDKFPTDLQFKETENRENFQGRYIIRHPFREEIKCEARENYLTQTRQRQEQEAQTLARLTGWNLATIRNKINWLETPKNPIKPPVKPWWETLWDLGD
jgi:hypothetical protein